MKKVKRKRKTQKKNAWLRFIEYSKSHYISALLFVIGVVVTLLMTKLCDRIIPDTPVVVEKIPDSINVVHVYSPIPDSVTVVPDVYSESNVETKLTNLESKEMKRQRFLYNENLNSINTSALFPNAKGYTARSAAPYFSLEMSPLNLQYVDFTCHFFDDEVITKIYCLSIKVFNVQNDKKVYVLDENYNIKHGDNIIRLKNIFTTGDYEIEVGFVFSDDMNSQYPCFYREVKYINNSQNK